MTQNLGSRSEKLLKIGFAIPPLDDKGGVNRVLMDLRDGLCSRGHEVHFFTFGKSSIISDDKTHVIDTNDIKEQKNQFHFLYEEENSKKKFDAFFANNIRTHRICVEYSIENLFLVFHQGAFLESKSVMEYLKKIRIARQIYNGQKLIGVSGCLISSLIKKYKINPKHIDIIYNPVNTLRIKTLSGKVVTDLPSEKYILHAGRFHVTKRHDHLIDAFSKIDKSFHLVLLGEGEEKGRIVSFIKEYGLAERVHLLGWKNNPYPYIKKAKVVVLTSDYEGLPTVIVESLLLNTPVVSTDCPCGPSEILEGSLSPFLVPKGDVEGLVRVIRSAIEDYPEIEDNMTQKFHIDEAVSKYLDIIDTGL